MIRIFSAAIFVLLLSMAPALAQQGPVEITSDRFVVNEGEAQATFSGNVVVKQTGLTVYAQRLVVHYGAGGSSDLKDFVASGNVRVVQPDQTATSNRGVFTPATNILRLTGNVKVTNSAGTVSGPALEVNINSGISEFVGQGSGGRVTGIFNAAEGDSE